MEGYKHLVECHCVLPQYRKSENPIFHKIVVFSEVDESGTVIAKLSRCENCGAVHKVFDICKSEIMISKEDSKNVLTKKDVSASLSKDLVSLFEENELGIADYELAKFYIDNNVWGSAIILTREPDEDGFSGKVVKIMAADRFRVEPYFDKDYV